MTQNYTFFDLVKVFIDFIKDWRFKTTKKRALTGFFTTLISLVGIFNVCIHIHYNQNIGVSWGELTISTTEATIGTIFLALFALIGFVVWLYFISKDEIKGVAKENSLFIQIYAPFVKHIFTSLDITNYCNWAERLIAPECVMTKERDHLLRDLAIYCGKLQSHEEYSRIQELIINFKILLTNFVNTYDSMADTFGNDGYRLRKIYKEYQEGSKDQDHYLKVYYQEWGLIEDFVYEITRLGNLLLEEIRKYDAGFMAEYGILTVVDAKDVEGKDAPIVYTKEEASKSQPYPGYSDFLEDRKNRNHRASNIDNNILIPYLQSLGFKIVR